jgi:hypothetical protein
MLAQKLGSVGYLRGFRVVGVIDHTIAQDLDLRPSPNTDFDATPTNHHQEHHKNHVHQAHVPLLLRWLMVAAFVHPRRPRRNPKQVPQLDGIVMFACSLPLRCTSPGGGSQNQVLADFTPAEAASTLPERTGHRRRLTCLLPLPGYFLGCTPNASTAGFSRAVAGRQAPSPPSDGRTPA